MGIHPLWIIAAAAIGWDAFILQWEVFSANPDLLDGRNRITMPSIETYRRFQMNESIRTMLRAGMSPAQVREELARVHSSPPQLGTIKRLMRKIAADERQDSGALCQGQLFEPGGGRGLDPGAA